MSTPPNTRALARSLLATEADEGSANAQSEPVTARVYEKLRHLLCRPVGTESFHALASRALMLAKSESPRLRAVHVSADGRLHGLIGVESQANTDQDGDGGVILIAQLLGLFLAFLGEATTLRLIQDLRLQAEAVPTSSPAVADTNVSEVDALVRLQAFEDLLGEIDRLRGVGNRIEALAHKHPEMESGLVKVAGNIRDMATVLDVFTLIRSKAGGPQEDATNLETNGYMN